MLPLTGILKAGLALHQEQYREADRRIEQALSEARSHSFDWAEANAHMIQARIELKTENPSRALVALRKAEAAADRAETRSFASWIHVLRVRARMQQDDRPRALAIFESLKDLKAPGATYGVQRAAISLGSAPSGTQPLPWTTIVFGTLLLGVVGLQLRQCGVTSRDALPAWLGEALSNDGYRDASPDRLPTLDVGSAFRPSPTETSAAVETVSGASAATAGPAAPTPTSTTPETPQARHLGGKQPASERRSLYTLEAPHVSPPDELADVDATGDLVAVESSDGRAVWARLFPASSDDDSLRGPRMLVVRDGGGVDISQANGAIGIVVGETSREQLPLPAPADVQWAGNGDAQRCRTWGELHAALEPMIRSTTPSTETMEGADSFDPVLPSVEAMTTQVADFLARQSVGHVEVRTDGEKPIAAHLVDQHRSAYVDREAVPVLFWHRTQPGGAYRGAAWPVVDPVPTQVFFGGLDTGVSCTDPHELVDLFARTLSVVSPERLALRVLRRASDVGPNGHVLVSGPGCRPEPDQWVLSTVETPDQPLPHTDGRVPIVVRSEPSESGDLVPTWN